MLNKDQALAAMDAQIIRVEAERKRRLERRTRHLTRLYPALKLAPLEQRQAIVFNAGRHTLRRWPIYAVAALVLAGIGAALFFPDSALSSTLVLGISATVLTLVLVLGVIFYRRMRGFVEQEVAAKFRGGIGTVRAPDA